MVGGRHVDRPRPLALGARRALVRWADHRVDRAARVARHGPGRGAAHSVTARRGRALPDGARQGGARAEQQRAAAVGVGGGRGQLPRLDRRRARGRAAQAAGREPQLRVAAAHPQ
eukprot:1885135-Prymnesium_polylepis.1